MPCKGCQNFATKYLGSPKAGSQDEEDTAVSAAEGQPPSVAMAAMQLLRDRRITREQYQQLIAQDRFYRSRNGAQGAGGAYVGNELWYHGPQSQKLRKTTIIADSPSKRRSPRGAGGTAGAGSSAGDNLLDALEETSDTPQTVDFAGNNLSDWALAMNNSMAEQSPIAREAGGMVHEAGHWENVMGEGMQADGAYLGKDIHSDRGHDCGASSVERIERHEEDNQGVSWTVGRDCAECYIGLSQQDNGSSFWTIDFALGCGENGHLRVYENGVVKGLFGRYKHNDRLSVRIKDNVISYHRNGIHLYTSDQAPKFPLVVDTSFVSPGAAALNLELVHYEGKISNHQTVHGFSTPVNVLGALGRLKGLPVQQQPTNRSSRASPNAKKEPEIDNTRPVNAQKNAI